MAMPKLINELPTASLGAGDLLAARVAGVTSQVTITQLITEAATFTQSGTVASARTVQDKVRDFVSVKDFGATGDGTTDDTTYIQAALDAHDNVFFPTGTYKCDGVLSLSDGAHLCGAGQGVTYIVRNGSNSAGQGLITADSGSSSAYVDDITIEEMTLNGQVATLGFSDFRHLIALHGARDVLIQRVEFLGYRGDGLYIASGLDLAGGDERHNINVTVRDCLFDGVNSDNRNGISVLDCDGLHILNNTFKNTTKSTMPGAIDIEPDGTYLFQVTRNINIIGNTIESCSGGAGFIVYLDGGPFTAPLFGLTIKDNFIRGLTKANAVAIQVSTAETISNSTIPMGVEICGNDVDDSGTKAIYPFLLRNVRDCKVEGNSFKGGTSAVIGLDTTASVTAYDIVVDNNLFYLNGNSSGSLSVYSVDNLRIEGNTFVAPNNGSATKAISFISDGIVTCVSSNVRLVDNTFIKGASQTTMCAVSTHTLSTSTNTNYGNRAVGGALTNTAFTAFYKGGGEVYEENTWTPVLSGGSTAGSQTYSVQQGSYTRIGNVVFLRASITLTAKDAAMAGSVIITGLPYTAVNVSNQSYSGAALHADIDLAAGYTQVNVLLSANTIQLLLRRSGDNVANAAVDAAEITATTSVVVSIFYFV